MNTAYHREQDAVCFAVTPLRPTFGFLVDPVPVTTPLI